MRLLDQTLLPETVRGIIVCTPEEMWNAIRRLAVRGAPAIGCAAAYGVVLGVRSSHARSGAALVAVAERVADYLATSRPTAVNLFWALSRMKATARAHADLSVPRLKARLLQEAQTIFAEDAAMCRAIGRNGARLIPRRQKPFGILTHCNAGALATSRYGTALAVIYAAFEAGKKIEVFADETRPLLQGARLTAWELQQAGVPVTLICDSTAAQVMREGRVQGVIVGADRIAANGDTANKIGTYSVAVLARHHGIPFYVAAPSSTFDFSLPDGSRIPIEQRAAAEVRSGFGRLTAPPTVPVYNPAFDVTPARLISAIVTERGVIQGPTRARLRAFFLEGSTRRFRLRRPGPIPPPRRCGRAASPDVLL